MVSMTTHYAPYKNAGVNKKKPYISAATQFRILSLVPHLFLDKLVKNSGWICKLSISICMNINENYRNERKIIKEYIYT